MIRFGTRPKKKKEQKQLNDVQLCKLVKFAVNNLERVMAGLRGAYALHSMQSLILHI